MGSLVAKGLRWFHTGGIMAALSEDATEVVREAMAAAKRHGTVVSFDGNYRASLWKERGGRAGAIAVNRLLLPMVDVLFGHEGDLVESEHSHQAAWHTLETFVPMAKRVSAEFPQVKLMVTSMRRVDSASRNDWSAFAFGEGGALEGMRLEGMEVMDRVGGGIRLLRA
jgi:2-dehydro-3-deoxygluconokinase